MGIHFQQQIPPQLSVSSIPIHGHDSGGGALNIEGHSIWPCASHGTYGGATCHSRVSSEHISLGHEALVTIWIHQQLLKQFLPRCWMSGSLTRRAEAPDRLWAGDVRTLNPDVQSWSPEVAVCPQMLADLDLVVGKREAGRTPATGQGRRCRGRPPGWHLPEEGREDKMRGGNKLIVRGYCC